MSEYEFLTASEPFSLRYEKLKELIAGAQRIVFFGGAGVSTGSGIPDFRSKNGLYIICRKNTVR